MKATAASARRPWAERLVAELDGRRGGRWPDLPRGAVAVGRVTQQVAVGDHEASLDEFAVASGLRATPIQVATRAAVIATLMAALLAWIAL